MFVVPVIGAVSDRHGRLPALRTSILATFLSLGSEDPKPSQLKSYVIQGFVPHPRCGVARF